jgi:hypothetical protein
MMNGYGTGPVWMFVMPAIWTGLIALIIWAVFRLTRARRDSAASENAEEDLRRRFAHGEITAEEFAASAGNPAPAGTTTGPRGHGLLVAVLIAAAGLLVTSVVGVTLGSTSPAGGNGYGPGYGGPSAPSPYHGPGTRTGTYGLPGTGPVRNMPEAVAAAQRFAGTRGLHVGEAMQFSNGYYAELLDPSGHGATEVLVDPQSGDVRVEQGPAMMWNTRYGMMPATQPTPVRISAEQAEQLAEQWLGQHQPGLHADDATAFPGYYTLHTRHDDRIVGMLSVNAQNGAVWYHTWHGQFIALHEQP